MKYFIKMACCLLALGFISIASNSYAGGPTQTMQDLKTLNQASALKTGDTVAMVCSKCKTVQVQTVDKEKSFLSFFTPKTKHLCPGCGGSVTMKENMGGKGSHGEYTHTCSKCGDESAFCCGGMAKGM